MIKRKRNKKIVVNKYHHCKGNLEAQISHLITLISIKNFHTGSQWNCDFPHQKIMLMNIIIITTKNQLATRDFFPIASWGHLYNTRCIHWSFQLPSDINHDQKRKFSFVKLISFMFRSEMVGWKLEMICGQGRKRSQMSEILPIYGVPMGKNY